MYFLLHLNCRIVKQNYNSELFIQIFFKNLLLALMDNNNFIT